MKEYEVLLKDGSIVLVLAETAEGALQEAAEQGHYGPVSATNETANQMLDRLKTLTDGDEVSTLAKKIAFEWGANAVTHRAMTIGILSTILAQKNRGE